MANRMTQLKFTLEYDLVAAFKRRCASNGVSMASAIRQFMGTSAPKRDEYVKTVTRPQRKKAVSRALKLLNEVLRDEEAYRDAIPEQFAQRYDTADETCECLAEAIERLENVYG